MDFELCVKFAVHDVLPDVPDSVIKDLIQRFHSTDVNTCAELLISHILENQIVETAETVGHGSMEFGVQRPSSPSAVTHVNYDQPLQHNVQLDDYGQPFSYSNSSNSSESSDLEIIEELTRINTHSATDGNSKSSIEGLSTEKNSVLYKDPCDITSNNNLAFEVPVPDFSVASTSAVQIPALQDRYIPQDRQNHASVTEGSSKGEIVAKGSGSIMEKPSQECAVLGTSVCAMEVDCPARTTVIQSLPLSTQSETVERPTDDTICFQCKEIWIGTYKARRCDTEGLNLVVTYKEIRFTVACSKVKEMVNISLQKEDISSIKFMKELSLLTIHTTPGCASSICTQLNMTEEEKVCFDPRSSDKHKKWITVIPCQLTDKQMTFLSVVFPLIFLNKVKQDKAVENICPASTQVHVPLIVDKVDAYPTVDVDDDLENQRFFERKASVVVDKVLSILPDTPIETITDLVKTFDNDDPSSCAELVLQRLLEANDNQLQEQTGYISDGPMVDEYMDGDSLSNDPDTFEERIDNGELALELETRMSQKRKRSFDDQDESTAPRKSAVIESENDEKFECKCCYNEVSFEELVQCAEGHLFCAECLRRYTQESVYGQGKITLSCMLDGCDETFPASQLMRALPEKLRLQYEERIAEEVLNLASLENLSRCPFCNYQAILEDDQHIFVCPNPDCEKRSCRKCGTVWQEHEGLECHQIEKEQETKLRTVFEEQMAEARIRTCPSCKARFTKESGCNKITCRCGQNLCYICRAKIKGYDHFCQHVRNPGKPCNKCKMCFLWTDAEYDDELAISEIKKKAEEARNNGGFEEKREIGAPVDERAAVKPTTNVNFAPFIPNRMPPVHYQNMADVIDQVARGNFAPFFPEPQQHMPRQGIPIGVPPIRLQPLPIIQPDLYHPAPPVNIAGLKHRGRKHRAIKVAAANSVARIKLTGFNQKLNVLDNYQSIVQRQRHAENVAMAKHGTTTVTQTAVSKNVNLLDSKQSLVQENVQNMVKCQYPDLTQPQIKLKRVAHQKVGRLASQHLQQAMNTISDVPSTSNVSVQRNHKNEHKPCSSVSVQAPQQPYLNYFTSEVFSLRSGSGDLNYSSAFSNPVHAESSGNAVIPSRPRRSHKPEAALGAAPNEDKNFVGRKFS